MAEGQRVHGLCILRTRATLFSQSIRPLLEWDGHVETPSAFFPEAAYRVFELCHLRIEREISQIFASLSCELGVNKWRLAVGYRITDNCVPVGHRRCLKPDPLQGHRN